MRSHWLTSCCLCACVFGDSARAGDVPVVSPGDSIIAANAASYDALGTALVAQDGKLLVGARGEDSLGQNSGAVYYFLLGPDGYQQAQKITPANPALAQEFGHALAIDDTLALVGAPLAQAVALLHFNGTNWTETDVFVPSMPVPDGRFGEALALAGDSLAIGAPGTDRNAGSVEVFTSHEGGWVSTAILVAPEATSNDRFGSAIALDGGTLLVGAPFEDSAGPDAGAVFVFEHGKQGWEQAQLLLPPQAGGQEYFGRRFVLEDDLLVVGAYRRDEVAEDSGAAFVYRRGADGFALEAVLVDPAARPGSEFGDSVDISGDRILIGGPADQARGVGAGAMWTFRNVAGTWVAESRIESASPEGYEFMGTAVCLDGAMVLGGAPLASLAAEYAGAVYVLDLSIDCDGDGEADVLAVANGNVEDCNVNGNPDSCDIAEGSETDKDDNGIPDSCYFDCNDNGINDSEDILKHPNWDFNQNGVLDQCECLADLVPNGVVDGADLGLLLVYIGAPCGKGTGNPDCIADFDGSGFVNGGDLDILLIHWGPCP